MAGDLLELGCRFRLDAARARKRDLQFIDNAACLCSSAIYANGSTVCESGTILKAFIDMAMRP